MNKEKWKIHSSGLIVSDNGSVMNRKGKLCFKKEQVTHRSLCEHFGVAHSTIGSILNYKSWITKSQFSL